MVRRNVLRYGALLNGPTIFFGLDRPDKPIGIGDTKSIRDAAEVFRSRIRFGLIDCIRTEGFGESFRDFGIDGWVIDGQGELIVVFEPWFLRRTGRLAFCS